MIERRIVTSSRQMPFNNATWSHRFSPQCQILETLKKRACFLVVVFISYLVLCVCVCCRSVFVRCIIPEPGTEEVLAMFLECNKASTSK